LPIYFENIPLDVRQRLWSQQDGALAHYSQDVRIFLYEQYPKHWIGQGRPVLWPPRSPNLNSLDYQIASHPDEVNYNVYETLALTMYQDTETIRT